MDRIKYIRYSYGMITLNLMKASLEQQLQEAESAVLADLRDNVLSQDEFEDLVERRDRLRNLVQREKMKELYGV